MRDIKPSVLSKIFAYAEKNVEEIQEEASKQMFLDCKGMKEVIQGYRLLYWSTLITNQ